MTKTLTKADLVDSIYEKTDRKRAEVKQQLEVLLSAMKEAIREERCLLVSGFGKFECYTKNPRRGRNPQTTETITLSERNVVVFRLSRKLREELNPQR